MTEKRDLESIGFAEKPADMASLLREFVEDDNIANYDTSCCWGCGGPKIDPCEPACLLERSRLALPVAELERAVIDAAIGMRQARGQYDGEPAADQSWIDFQDAVDALLKAKENK